MRCKDTGARQLYARILRTGLTANPRSAQPHHEAGSSVIAEPMLQGGHHTLQRMSCPPCSTSRGETATCRSTSQRSRLNSLMPKTRAKNPASNRPMNETVKSERLSCLLYLKHPSFLLHHAAHFSISHLDLMCPFTSVICPVLEHPRESFQGLFIVETQEGRRHVIIRDRHDTLASAFVTLHVVCA